MRSCAQRLTGDRVDLAGYSLTQQADDMEAARVALGYGPVNLLSESAGTRTTMIYAWRYPESIRRSVMLAVNPPGHYFWDGETTGRQIARYAELCAADDACRGRTDDLAASMKRVAADMPDRWGILPIEEANVRAAAFLGLMESTTKAGPVNGPATLDSSLSAAEGDAAGLWLASLAGEFLFPGMFTRGQYAGIGAQDAHVADASFAAGGDQGSILGNALTDFVWGGGRLGHAWPVSPDDARYRRVRTSRVETLLIGGELDFATPPQAATKELLPYLPNGHQVVLAGFGHTLTFCGEQPEAGTRLINTFFDSGQVDDSLYKPGIVDFTPSLTQTAIAKIVFGTMVGFALVTVISLAWMARRVHKRGRIGSTAGAVLRTLHPVVLGLGGWFLVALVVMTAMPGVPVDGERLVALSVGVPDGLGIWLAWTNRDWSVTTRATGYGAAAGAALVGAWLGFNATEGLVALVTAVVGAAVGANVALLALDIAWDHQGRGRFPAPDTDGSACSWSRTAELVS
ncbi:MAG: alpha/beta hydrolase [Acidimicrobiales bacterium]